MKVKIKILFATFFVSVGAGLTACDVRSDIAKKNMEKYVTSPTPTVAPTAASTPIDPADIIEVDTSQEGRRISLDGSSQKKTAACTKFDRIIVNGDKNEITITGVCRQIMINGDGNKITADAVMEFILNGSENLVRYSRFANGKRPTVIENRPGNVIEKVSPGAAGKK